MHMLRIAICTICILLPLSALADDSGAEITPPGLLLKETTSITIEQQELHISKSKVEAASLFRNNSERALVTEATFPIPEYSFAMERTGGDPAFTNFLLEINGRPVPVAAHVQALARGKDVTQLLQRRDISIEDFEEAEDSFDQLLAKIGKEKERFLAEGIIDEEGMPLWSVRKSYYWGLSLPAGGTVTVKYSYTPVTGFRFLDMDEEPDPAVLAAICADKGTEQWLKKALPTGGLVMADSLGYPLKSGNPFKEPIKKFLLRIDRDPAEHLSVCYDRTFTLRSAERFESYILDYTPTRDLKVFWLKLLNVEEQQGAEAESGNSR